MLKFLHAADIHLDSPRAGLDRDETAPAEEIRHAPRRALKNLVQCAIEERVDFVLIAGDLYDGDWRDFRTGLFFVEQMVPLREANIPVFLIAGNHDARNKMTKSLNLPDNVRFLSEDEPETVVLDHKGAAIHGQGFAQAAVLDDLSAGYPAPIAGLFNIGLLHTCATKSGEHERYAPCTLDGLATKQYQYWALGHIHKREILSTEPHVVFPGNVQGRNIRETGAKGCCLVTVDRRENVAVEFRPLDVFRWERCPIDVAGAETGDEVVARVETDLARLVAESEGRPLAVRIELAGPTPAHQELSANPRRWQSEIQAQAAQFGEGQIWVERVERRTTPPVDIEALMSDGPLAELDAYLRELACDDAALADLAAELTPLAKQLPQELQNRPDHRPLDDSSRLREWLDDARQTLIHRLTQRGSAT